HLADHIWDHNASDRPSSDTAVAAAEQRTGNCSETTRDCIAVQLPLRRCARGFACITHNLPVRFPMTALGRAVVERWKRWARQKCGRRIDRRIARRRREV